MSKEIFLETMKLKNMNSGLGQFCFHLGHAINQQNNTFDLTYYLPERCEAIFGNGLHYLRASPWHRLLGVPLHANLFHWLYQGSPYWPKQRDTKVVLTVHDLNFTVKYSGWRRKFKMDELQRQADRADRIVSISNYTRHEILRHLEVDGKKLSVIYNGLSVPSLNQQKPFFAPNKKFFFTIGIIAFKKNFHVLLPILKMFEDYVLIIAGNNSGAYAHQIRSKASGLGIADRILLPGEISEGEKQWLYNNCEAFLFPSLTEGFGLPVIEAMAFGKPVFISKLTSLPEIGGPHAYYFHDFQTDHMIEIIKSGLKDYQDKPEKKEEIKKWANRFSWDTAAKEYLQLYTSLLS